MKLSQADTLNLVTWLNWPDFLIELRIQSDGHLQNKSNLTQHQCKMRHKKTIMPFL